DSCHLRAVALHQMLLPAPTRRSSDLSDQRASGTAITAASSTFGCAISAFSSATDEIHSPPLLIRSLVRSAISSVALENALMAHRSEEHTSELQSPDHLVCRLLPKEIN